MIKQLEMENCGNEEEIKKWWWLSRSATWYNQETSVCICVAIFSPLFAAPHAPNTNALTSISQTRCFFFIFMRFEGSLLSDLRTRDSYVFSEYKFGVMGFTGLAEFFMNIRTTQTIGHYDKM